MRVDHVTSLYMDTVTKRSETLYLHTHHHYPRHTNPDSYISQPPLPLPPTTHNPTSLLILPPHNRHMTMFQLILQILIHRKRNRLPRRDPHNPRRDPLIKRMKALLLKHIPRDGRNATHGRLARYTRRLLEAGLDGIDRGVTQGPHGAADQADDHGLVAGELGVVVGRLPALQAVLEVRVGGEVDRLVGPLAQGGQRHAAVEGAHAFFLEYGVQGVCGVAVFRDVERVGHAVVLRLQADLDYFHGRHDGDGFGDAGEETGWGVRGRGLVGGSFLQQGGGNGGGGVIPRKVAWPLTAPVSLSARSCL